MKVSHGTSSRANDGQLILRRETTAFVLELSYRNGGTGVYILRLSGEFDLYGQRMFSEIIEDGISDAVHALIVVDLSGLLHLDSTALGALGGLRSRIFEFALASVPVPVRKVFELTSFRGVPFPHFDNTDAAVEYLREFAGDIEDENASVDTLQTAATKFRLRRNFIVAHELYDRLLELSDSVTADQHAKFCYYAAYCLYHLRGFQRAAVLANRAVVLDPRLKSAQSLLADIRRAS